LGTSVAVRSVGLSRNGGGHPPGAHDSAFPTALEVRPGGRAAGGSVLAAETVSGRSSTASVVFHVVANPGAGRPRAVPDRLGQSAGGHFGIGPLGVPPSTGIARFRRFTVYALIGAARRWNRTLLCLFRQPYTTRLFGIVTCRARRARPRPLPCGSLFQVQATERVLPFVALPLTPSRSKPARTERASNYVVFLEYRT